VRRVCEVVRAREAIAVEKTKIKFSEVFGTMSSADHVPNIPDSHFDIRSEQVFELTTGPVTIKYTKADT